MLLLYVVDYNLNDSDLLTNNIRAIGKTLQKKTNNTCRAYCASEEKGYVEGEVGWERKLKEKELNANLKRTELAQFYSFVLPYRFRSHAIPRILLCGHATR